MRMEDSRLPKQIFCSELARDTRKRYEDSLKNSLRPVTSLLKAGNTLQQIAALGGWQPTTEPKSSRKSDSYSYWAIQAGLLTPLAFARYHLSPLAAFTSVRTFFTMEGGDSEFANFTLPTLKAFLEARSHNLSGNKQ